MACPSLHQLPLSWVAHTTWFGASLKILSKSGEMRFIIYFYAGDRRLSIPACKLDAPQQYDAFEVDVFSSAAQPVYIKNLFSRILMKAELESLDLVAGSTQPHVGHRQCVRIITLLKFIADLEE